MSRRTLPQRRPNVTMQTSWADPAGAQHLFTVTIGFDNHGKPMELFANHAKGAMAATLADACVVISLALQHGISPADLAKSLPRVPQWPDGDAPASPVGTIVDCILGEIE